MRSGTASILVVDDEQIIRQQVLRALKIAGLNAESAVDGRDALRKIAQRPYDLVVTDLRMPEQHGHSLIVTLLQQESRPKIVALTGVKEPRLKSDLLARGVDQVHYKPVDYFELARNIRCLLATSPDSLSLGTTPNQRVDSARLMRDELESHLLQSQSDGNWMTHTMQWMDWKAVPNPPADVQDRITRLAVLSPAIAVHSRRAGKVVMNELAIAFPMDANDQPSGGPFKATVCTASRTALSLLHIEPVECERLTVMWRTRRKARVIVMVQISECRQFSGYFEIEGCIVAESPAVS